MDPSTRENDEEIIIANHEKEDGDRIDLGNVPRKINVVKGQLKSRHSKNCARMS